MTHKPVLLKEVLKFLDPRPNENFIDCTIGEGGHAAAILENIKPNGKLLGIDWDKEQFSIFNLQFSNRLILVNDSYINLEKIVKENNFAPVNGVLLDLGFSSAQLEKSGRGFSFLKNGPLDMRYDAQNELSAEKIINSWPEKEIERILREYGEEKFSKQIAKKISQSRKIKPIKTTFELVKIIGGSYFARKTFQALRIAVNDELENLKKVLPQAVSVLSPEGRMAVISFHSLEDRIVKNFLNNLKNKDLKLLNKKPITASESELAENPRARSAKLRVAEKI